MKCIVILSKSKRNYLADVGCYPIEGFDDFYVITKSLRKALRDYDIRTCFYTRWT